VTPAKGIWFVYGLTMALYITLAVVTGVVLRGLSKAWRETDAERVAELPDIPYGPPPSAEAPR
jgi:hypothetical protein